ncbi:hypothetical protein E3J84_00135 [Candidatus Aerophobetes bacterium]|uniref:Uncharacterized protein n=1 Tax=Aerophobetes bacterium TaxID=2030807 RepID=A0A523S5W3_UNCAE|nr:MAG: hypothetical protein E3J84_00135 [Candidatus Aerophobetes bacterium]
MKRKYRKYEKRVREEFEAWLKKCHRDWLVSKKPIKTESFPRLNKIKKEKFSAAEMIKGQKSPRVKTSEKIFKEKTLFETYWLSPDIDVLAYCKASDELIGYEIKKPQFRPKKYVRSRKGGKEIAVFPVYKNAKLIRYYKELLGKGSEEKFTQPYYPDLGIIYKGMGQALFNLRYVDQSFLVLPDFKKFLEYISRHSHPIFLNTLLDEHLPLGLIEYEYCFTSDDELDVGEFKVIRKGKSSSLWQSLQSYKNQIDLLYEYKIRDLLKEKLKKGKI